MSKPHYAPALDLEDLFQKGWLCAEEPFEISISSTPCENTPRKNWRICYNFNHHIPATIHMGFAYKDTMVYWDDENIDTVEFHGLHGASGDMVVPIVSGHVLFRYHCPEVGFSAKYYSIQTKQPTVTPPRLTIQSTPLYWFDKRYRCKNTLTHLFNDYRAAETGYGFWVYSTTNPKWPALSLEKMGEIIPHSVSLEEPPIDLERMILHVTWGNCTAISPLKGLEDITNTDENSFWLASMPMQKNISVHKDHIPLIKQHFQHYLAQYPEEARYFSYSFEPQKKTHSDYQKQMADKLKQQIVDLHLKWYQTIQQPMNQQTKQELEHVEQQIKWIHYVFIPFEPTETFAKTVQELINM